MKSPLSAREKIQHEEYGIPYHYRDLFSEEHVLRTIEYRDYLSRVKKEIFPLEGKNVLDIGCGDGRFFYELRNTNAHLVGIDYSEDAIRFARAFNPNAIFHIGDASTFVFGKKFDAITLIEVLEHIPPEKADSLLAGISRNLKKAGLFVITVPSLKRPLVEKHYRHFTPELLQAVLEPHFRTVKLIGYSRHSGERKRFEWMRKLALLVFPFRGRGKWVKQFAQETEEFYHQKLGIGPPNECDGLLAVCRKK